ncbi:hypothetical protein CDL15_Pgr022358 [Punica granatum]|uniref:Uncharacterized protein n=1 Tax=Punica granatum TaxID=22663 RepID=A0A218Y461_PUNGR|nr:hypothetical protein CDL15_Pgr022358 [Punica granatum]
MGLLEVGLDLWWVGFGLFFVEQTRMAQDRPNWAVFGSEVTAVAPDGILMQVVVVWFQTYRVDPYSPAKITENRVRLENRPDWAVFGSDFTTVSPDGIVMQGQCLPTPN